MLNSHHGKSVSNLISKCETYSPGAWYDGHDYNLQTPDRPVDVAVDVVLPVAHVHDHVPGEAGGTRGGVRCPARALVVHVAVAGVGEVALASSLH